MGDWVGDEAEFVLDAEEDLRWWFRECESETSCAFGEELNGLVFSDWRSDGDGSGTSLGELKDACRFEWDG